MRGPADPNPKCVAMFFGGVDTRTGRLSASRLIDKDRRRGPELLRGEAQLTIPAEPAFNQVTAVIVQAHRNQIPINHNLACGQTAGAHVLRRIIKFCKGKQRSDLRHAAHIPIKFQNLDTHPTVIEIVPRIHINPGRILIAAQNRYSICGE